MRRLNLLGPRRIRKPADAWYYLRALVRKLTVEHGSDPELRQLRSLRRAYASDRGPDVLVFGDSAMVYTTPLDPKRHSLGDMIRAELGRDHRILMLGGPGYNARIVSAFLTALEDSRSKPSVIVVPTSVLMSMSLWSESPRYSYHHEAAAIRQIITRQERIPRKGLPRSSQREYEDHDRLPAPSLFGARRTVGELRLILNAVPTTRWQTAVRMRHIMDFYNAERLEQDSPGIQYIDELGAHVAKLEVSTIAYISPVNHVTLRATLGDSSIEHLTRNASMIASTFLARAGPQGHVVNAVLDSPPDEFVDPVHLTYEGRRRMAHSLTQAIRPRLTVSKESR